MRAVPLFCSLLLAAIPASAQLTPSSEAFGGNCATASSSVRDACFATAEASRILGARAVILLSGGNPVPGTASTLGMRIGSQPRVSIAARVTGGRVDIPPLNATGTADDLDFTAAALSLDVGVGVFGGLTLGPTIGGFGSIDLIGSVGRLWLPKEDGFSGSVGSWAAGARVGLLRESFTAPGASISVLHRRVGDLGYGDQALSDHDAWFRLENLGGWSIRAAASKRLLGLGVTAGAGHDRFTADALARVRDATSTSGRFELTGEPLQINRNTLFTSAAFNILVLHTVAELGWQSGGGEEAGLPTTGRLDHGGIYGSLAVRLSL